MAKAWRLNIERALSGQAAALAEKEPELWFASWYWATPRRLAVLIGRLNRVLARPPRAFTPKLVHLPSLAKDVSTAADDGADMGMIGSVSSLFARCILLQDANNSAARTKRKSLAPPKGERPASFDIA